MKIAETVTFGGTGLNRAAEMRADVARLAEIARSGRADVLLFWCGKPLVEDAVDDMGSPRLCRLPADHPLLPEVSQEAVFMGMHDGRAIFAAELVGWEPELPEDSTIGQFVDTSRQQHPDLPENQTFTELRSVMAALSPLDAELAATAKAIMSWHASHKFCALCGNQSLMAMAGWQRDCPRCGGQHFPRTDPVVIMLITRGNNVLLGRSPGWPEGMYSLLAGFVEPGEPIEGAVRREVLEETGINVGRVAYLASQPWPFPTSLMMGCRGEALTDEITLDPNELEDALWLSREELARAMASDHPSIRAPRKGSIAQFLLYNWLADRLD